MRAKFKYNANGNFAMTASTKAKIIEISVLKRIVKKLYN